MADKASIEIRVWTDGNDALPSDDSDLAELLAPHVERIAGLCAKGYRSGDVYAENEFRGWWEVKR